MKQEIEIVIANATELKPGKHYIFMFDNGSIQMDTMQKVLKKLDEIGIGESIGLKIYGNPNEVVKIIEKGEDE